MSKRRDDGHEHLFFDGQTNADIDPCPHGMKPYYECGEACGCGHVCGDHDPEGDIPGGCQHDECLCEVV